MIAFRQQLALILDDLCQMWINIIIILDIIFMI